MFPIPAVNQAWNQTVIPQAFLEPALLHALLGITSSTIKLKYVKPFNPSSAFAELLSHKVASINLINRKLRNVSDATQLSTILTVVTLFGCEVSKFNSNHVRHAYNRTNSWVWTKTRMRFKCI